MESKLQAKGEVSEAKGLEPIEHPTVLVLGTGTIAFPFVVLLRKALGERAEIFVAKKSPISENVARISRLRELNGIKFAVWQKDKTLFDGVSFDGFRYQVDATVEEVASSANLIMDCTGASIQEWSEELLASRPVQELRGIAVEGSIKGFGPYFMYGVTDDVLELSRQRKIQIPSCNTHCLTSIIWALSDKGRDLNRFRQVVCFIDRRNQDKGKAGSAVHTLTYEKIKDEEFGTHQAKDAVSVLKLALGDAFPQHLRVVSHAQKTPQPFMHATYFCITVEGQWDKEMVHQRLRSFHPPEAEWDNVKPFIAFTDYMTIGQVYEEYCLKGLSSRGCDYAVVVANQTHVIGWPCGESCGQELSGESQGTFSTIMLSTLTPQEGNVIISNVACALKFLYPSDYRKRVNELIREEHLLFGVV